MYRKHRKHSKKWKYVDGELELWSLLQQPFKKKQKVKITSALTAAERKKLFSKIGKERRKIIILKF